MFDASAFQLLFDRSATLSSAAATLFDRWCGLRVCGGAAGVIFAANRVNHGSAAR